MRRPKVGFVSLGCPKNLVDTERMMDLVSTDSILTGDHSNADVVVINTCGFLEPAKNESLSTIGEFVELKNKGRIKGVIVAGCMTERYLDLMSKQYPDVDAFLQTKAFSEITSVVKEIVAGESEKLRDRMNLLGDAAQLSGHSELPDFNERSPGKRSFAYVKIAEGCNRTCSFCIIPKLRGKLHSRSIEGILNEVETLAKYGTQEVIFIAQDLTSYGRDRSDGADLKKLLSGVDQIEGISWYRLMYNYPRFFDDELIQLLSASRSFSGYLDIPFQHISDQVLSKMRRPESSADIRGLINKLKSSIPHLSLRTTLMVGFPGETESDFEELLKFVEEVEFDHLGAFTYFQEKGTPSAEMIEQIPEEVKKDRYQRLMKLQAGISKRKLSKFKGKVIQVMVDALSDKIDKNWIYRGRHSGQAPEIDGITYFSSTTQLDVGRLVEVEINKAIGQYDLLGTYSAEVAQLVEQRIRNA